MKKRILYNVTKQIAPNWGKRLYHAARGWVNRRRSTADVFSAIYSVRHWGIQGEFDSGVGTADDGVTGPYLRVLFEQIERLGVTGADFVDLGCGDFKVGAQVAALAGSYVGVDVVPDLVKFLNGKYGSAKLSFRCMNMVEDELPAGEVCFIRQVLQHLSNEQILQILPKLRAYKHIFITEHDKPTFVDGLITNYHVPRSSLLMLVSAFTGRETLLDLYKQAISKEFRFFSFGDGMIVL